MKTKSSFLLSLFLLVNYSHNIKAISSANEVTNPAFEVVFRLGSALATIGLFAIPTGFTASTYYSKPVFTKLFQLWEQELYNDNFKLGTKQK